MIRAAVLFVFVSLWWCVGSAQSLLRVHFLDVGQGDAVLIQSPAGPNVLYDGGDSPTTILRHLDALGISRLDLVVASHNHADHIGGLAEVITRFRPSYYLDNGLPTTTLTYRRVLAAVQAAGTELLEPTARQIRLGEDGFIDVLPPSRVKGWDQNDNAVGLIVTYGSFRLSLAGDAEQRQWANWIEHHTPLLGNVDVHKASHHGSTNGDIPAALAMLAPKTVVISVGLNNNYGHPRPQMLELYAARGSTTFRTDINGTVSVEADVSGRYTVRPQRGQGAAPRSLLTQRPEPPPPVSEKPRPGVSRDVR